MVSVIIPACNEFPQIAFTLDSISQDLRGMDYEILVIFNNNHDQAPEYLENRGKNIRLLDYDGQSCWQARNLGATEAKGDVFVFLDAHVLLEPCTIPKAISVLNEPDCGVVWFAMRYLLDVDRVCYGYELKPEKFWGNWTTRRRAAEPYPLTMSGVGGMAVSRKVFRTIGGWNKSLGIYGGGEPYFAFKSERLGFRNYLSPQSVFAHFAAKRGYCWNNDDLWRNFLMAAYAVGGEFWLGKLRGHYAEKCKGNANYMARLEILCDEARDLAQDDNDDLEKRAKLSLGQVISRDLEFVKNS